MTDGTITTRELTEEWTLTLLLWSPLIIYFSGYADEAIVLFIWPIENGLEVVGAGFDETFSTLSDFFGAGSSDPPDPAPTTPTRTPVDPHDLPPGPFLLVGLIQLVIMLFVFVLFLGIVMAATITVAAYLFLLVGQTWKTLRLTKRYVGQASK